MALEFRDVTDENFDEFIELLRKEIEEKGMGKIVPSGVRKR